MVTNVKSVTGPVDGLADDGARVLVLHLKRKWFDMIVSGDKRCEYRELDKWFSRLWCEETGSVRCWDFVVFACGYPSLGELSRWCAFRCSAVDVGPGRQQWGALSGRLYWRIWLGDSLDVWPWLVKRFSMRFR